MDWNDPEQRRAYDRARYAANPAKYRARVRAWTQAHREQVRDRKRQAWRKYYDMHGEKERARGRAKDKKWRISHPQEAKVRDHRYRTKYQEKARLRERIYHHKNAQRRHAIARLYRMNNAEKLHAKNREYRLAHHEQILSNNHNYRARKKGSQINDFTHAQWIEVQNAQNHRCYYCKKRCKNRLTQDHILALSKGGSHTLHNVIAACKLCNTSKGNRPPKIPVQPLLLTIASSKKNNLLK
jgi:hypothetical protein